MCFLAQNPIVSYKLGFFDDFFKNSLRNFTNTRLKVIGGTGSIVAKCLTEIKSQKAPVNLEDELVVTLNSIFKAEDDVKNEDEIDLDAISDDDEKPPVDLKSHLQGLISKGRLLKLHFQLYFFRKSLKIT